MSGIKGSKGDFGGIKTYLRANMEQDRLNGLAMLSIEKGVASELDYSSVITKFASLKTRRVSF